jgi:hypothetical protein
MATRTEESTPNNGLNGGCPHFTKQAFIRNDFHPKSNIAKVLELIIDNGLAGKLEVNLNGDKDGCGVTAITFWEKHPVDVENSD